MDQADVSEASLFDLGDDVRERADWIGFERDDEHPEWRKADSGLGGTDFCGDGIKQFECESGAV